MDNRDKEKKALVITTVASTIDQFCMNDINLLQKSCVVTVAANFDEGNNTSKNRIKDFIEELKTKKIKVENLKLNRNPFNPSNLIAYKEIRKLLKNQNFDIIHCHTPIAAMLLRIAARNVRKNKGTKVIYTAHGFHFYKGAPIKNWLIYYPIERFLSKYTDVIININKEDYNFSRKHLQNTLVKYIPGVGVDVNKFSNDLLDVTEKRREFGIEKDAFVVLSIGELNKNKNHEVVIKAMAKMSYTKIYYLIAGQGGLENDLKILINKLGLEKKVHLLGFRKDISELYAIADIFAFPSFREGLSLALMESMAAGLPVVCSKIRGNVDLIVENSGGYHIDPQDIDGFYFVIDRFYNDKLLREKLSEFNKEYIKNFDIKKVNGYVDKIYEECL